jgi:hypothetical protein
MANKIKFEMSVKEITFKFEGDYEQGQRLQSGISKTLGELGKLQTMAVGAEEPKQITGSVTTLPKRRSRRKRTEDADSNAENGPQGNGADQGHGEERRSTGTSVSQLLRGLRETGFFSNPKTTKEIVSHLATAGHTGVRSSSLTATLQNLVRKNELKRAKNAEDIWGYSNV